MYLCIQLYTHNSNRKMTRLIPNMLFQGFEGNKRGNRYRKPINDISPQTSASQKSAEPTSTYKNRQMLTRNIMIKPINFFIAIPSKYDGD